MHHRDVQLVRHSRSVVCGQRGSSLVDMLVGTALGLVTLATVLGFYRFQLFALRNQSASIEVQTAARSIVNLMVGEIRRAAADPTCAKSFEGIAEAFRNRLRIRSDLNASGAIDAAGEDVLYSFDSASGRLTRTAGGVTEDLSDANFLASDVRFQYYDGNGTELVPGTNGLTQTQRASVRRVRLSLTLQRRSMDPRSQQLLTATVSSAADLRNRFLVSVVTCS